MTLRELGPGTLAVLFGNGLGVLAAFGIRWLMARALTPAEVGLAMLALALCTSAAGVATLGLHTAAAHRLSVTRARGQEDAARAGARTALALAAASGAAFTLAVALAAPSLARLFAEAALTEPLRLAAPNIVAMAVGGALYGVARAFDDLAGRVLLRDGLGNLWRLLGVVTACAVAPTAPAVILGFTLGSILAEGGFVLFALRRRWVGRAAPWDVSLVRSLPPFAALSLLFQAAQWFDLILLGFFAPAAVIGVYSVARGVARILDLAGDTASQQFLSSASAAHASGGRAALRTVFLHTRSFMLCLLLPPLAIVLAEPAFLLAWVFGPAYADGAPALRLLAAGIALAALCGYCDKALVAANRAAAATRSALIAVVAGIVVLFLTTPTMGARGAALGWMTFVVVQSVGNAFVLWRTTGVHPLSPDLLLVAAFIAVPAAAMIAASRSLASSPWPTIAGAGLVSLAGAALALRRLDRSSDRGSRLG